MPTVFIPASLRKYTNGQQLATVAGENVREVIASLEAEFPGIESRLCRDGKLFQGLAVAVDARVSSNGLLESVRPDSEVTFVPTVSGG